MAAKLSEHVWTVAEWVTYPTYDRHKAVKHKPFPDGAKCAISKDLAAELFLICFKEAYGKEYRLIRQQERPDAIIEDEDGNRLGLEVTHLFYDALEVKMLLGRSKQVTHEPENFEDYIKVLDSEKFSASRSQRITIKIKRPLLGADYFRYG